MKKIVRFALNHIPRPWLQRFSRVALRAYGVLYVGRRYECPICGRRLRKLLPYGYVQPRENALCPGCMSLERHRQLWIFLREKTDFFARRKVLHVAPESCFIRRFQAMSSVDYYSADLESPLARIKMDVQKIPFGDNFFDVIFCNHVMEHVDNDRLAMRELYRVMKPGGWGVIQSPISYGRAATYEDAAISTPKARLQHFGQKDHVREYGCDYADRLREAGFTVEEVAPEGYLNAAAALRFALSKEIIYYVTK